MIDHGLLSPVYTIQPVVKPVVQPVSQPVVSCKRGIRFLMLKILAKFKYGVKICNVGPIARHILKMIQDRDTARMVC